LETPASRFSVNREHFEKDTGSKIRVRYFPSRVLLKQKSKMIGGCFFIFFRRNVNGKHFDAFSIPPAYSGRGLSFSVSQRPNIRVYNGLMPFFCQSIEE